MTIFLDGLSPSIDLSDFFTQAYRNTRAHPADSHSALSAAHAPCPSCGKLVSDPGMVPGYSETSPDSSPLVLMDPLAAVAFESGMSAVEEFRLLKAQVSESPMSVMMLQEAILVKK